MKTEVRQKACELRRAGRAVKVIAKMLGVSQSSVSVWVRDIPLTAEQSDRLRKRELNASTAMVLGIKRRASERREAWRIEAERDFSFFWRNPDFVFGLGIYAGEGDKTGNVCAVTNSDPNILKAAFRFFDVIGVSKERVKLSVWSYPDLDTKEVENFWNQEIGITPRVYMTNGSLAGKGRRTKSRFGTARLKICSTGVVFKTLLWLQMAYRGAEKKLPSGGKVDASQSQ
jgi:transposase-like protein